MTTDPTTVTSAQLRAALDQLGIPGPVEDITHVRIEPQHVVVVRLRRDDNGDIAVAGDVAATVTTTIGIDWSDE